MGQSRRMPPDWHVNYHQQRKSAELRKRRSGPKAVVCILASSTPTSSVDLSLELPGRTCRSLFDCSAAALTPSGARGLKEFVAYVKANSATLDMAHGGIGSNAFNFGLRVNSILGVKRNEGESL